MLFPFLRQIVLPSLLLIPGLALSAGPATSEDVVARGKYLVQISGCNDCHTPGYPESGGMVPLGRWLTGNPVGFQGPWGTSYPVNLRLYVQNMNADDWLKKVRQPMRPPMPWFALRDMTDDDVLAIYHFIRSIGPAGMPAPTPAKPGVAVNTPYIDFVPKNLPKAAMHP